MVQRDLASTVFADCADDLVATTFDESKNSQDSIATCADVALVCRCLLTSGRCRLTSPHRVPALSAHHMSPLIDPPSQHSAGKYRAASQTSPHHPKPTSLSFLPFLFGAFVSCASPPPPVSGPPDRFLLAVVREHGQGLRPWQHELPQASVVGVRGSQDPAAALRDGVRPHAARGRPRRAGLRSPEIHQGAGDLVTADARPAKETEIDLCCLESAVGTFFLISLNGARERRVGSTGVCMRPLSSGANGTPASQFVVLAVVSRLLCWLRESQRFTQPGSSTSILRCYSPDPNARRRTLRHSEMAQRTVLERSTRPLPLVRKTPSTTTITTSTAALAWPPLRVPVRQPFTTDPRNDDTSCFFILRLPTPSSLCPTPPYQNIIQRTQREYIVEYLRLHLRIAGAAREGCTEDDRDAIFDAVPTLYR